MTSLLLVVLGWASAARAAEDCSPPQFYAALPRDRDWYYGVGRDADTDKARGLALRALSRQVTGSFKDWDERDAAAVAGPGRDRAKVARAMDEALEQTPLAGWEQDDFARCGGFSYVLVRIEKEKAKAFFRERKSVQKIVRTVIQRTIVVREGDKTFADPSACRQDLADYAAPRGESDEASTKRVAALGRAETDCAKLDYRDVPLQTELLQKLLGATQARTPTVAIHLNRRMLAESELVKRIAALGKAESDKLGSKAQGDQLRLLLLKHFDLLWTGGRGYDPRKAEPAYSELVRSWPSALAQPLKVCAQRRVSSADAGDTEACFSMSRLEARANWASIKCLNQAPHEPQCAITLMRESEQTCPELVDRRCFEAAAAQVKDATGVALAWADKVPAR